MIFDELGLPRVTGASDLQDSAALAGMMSIFEWPKKIQLTNYVVRTPTFHGYVRHPNEIKYDFSRDQAICLLAGFAYYRQYNWVDESFISGKDILSPSVRGHIQRCKGLQASWFQDLWFWADLAFSAKFKPLDELNQLFCMMMVADSKFIKWYCRNNPQWPTAIKNYWCEGAGAWRAEPELAQLMIKKINERIGN